MVKSFYLTFTLISIFIQVLAHNIILKISSNVRVAEMFTIIADENADVANIEQLVICIRWIDEQHNAHEEIIDLHPIPDTTANTIVSVLKVSIKVLKLFGKVDNQLTQ